MVRKSCWSGKVVIELLIERMVKMLSIFCKCGSMKRTLYAVFFFMLIFFPGVEAGSVKVKGMGMDKESAVRDAMRVAVERVIGTYVDSKTLVEQATVVEDTILAKSQGFVTDVQILSEGKADDGYWVNAKVEVNENPNSELRNQLQMVLM